MIVGGLMGGFGSACIAVPASLMMGGSVAEAMMVYMVAGTLGVLTVPLLARL